MQDCTLHLVAMGPVELGPVELGLVPRPIFVFHETVIVEEHRPVFP